ncbi:MAG: hypothetical protein QXP42_00960 [Candidatus Micrarchaeia archaeon]
MKRAQIATLDMLLAITVLLLIVFSFIMFLIVEMHEKDKKSHADSERILSALVGSSGKPSNWTSTHFIIPGLKCGQGVVCANKIKELNNSCGSSSQSGYVSVKKSLGIPTQYYLIGYYASNSERCLCGCDLSERRNTALEVSKSSLLVSLDNNITRLSIYLWNR